MTLIRGFVSLFRRRPVHAARPVGTATRFMISCAARTGSTLLKQLLDSHPRIRCHGEVFTPDRITGFSGLGSGNSLTLDRLSELRRRDPVRFLHEHVLDPGACAAVGFKLKYTEFQLAQWRGVGKAVTDDRDIRIIHLTRANRLKRYVSHFVAERVTKVTQAVKPEDIPPAVRVRLSPAECRADIQATERAEQQFRKLFRDHQVFEVTYEQLLDASGETVGSLQKFLGVEPVRLSSKTLKLNSDRLEDLLENHAELQAYFQGKPEAAYFGDAREAA